MIWFGLLVVIIAIVFFLRSRYNEEEEIQAPVMIPATAVLPETKVDTEDDGELLAVIAAAVAEFEGSSDFQVLSITPRTNSTWMIAARQEPVYNRL